MARYKYYNREPFGRTLDDCVTRAISLALEEDYHYIGFLLYQNAEKNGCDRLTKLCYRQILEDKFNLKPRQGNGRTVGEVADMYPYDRVIMRVEGHCTCSIPYKGEPTVMDLFNCLDYQVDTYWVVYN